MNMKRFFITTLLLILLISCSTEDTVSQDKFDTLTALTVLTNSDYISYKISTDPVELEGQVYVWDETNNEKLAFFSGVEENISGNIWSADYTDVSFPTGSAKSGTYYSQIIDWSNGNNVMYTRRARVCYGKYSDITNYQSDGTTLKKYAACDSSLTSQTTDTNTYYSSTNSYIEDTVVSNDDTKVKQMWHNSQEIGYFVVTWSELNSSSITYLCLVGPFQTYKNARDHYAGSNVSKPTSSSSVCKDASGRESVPSTFDTSTNRFGYAPFVLKISK